MGYFFHASNIPASQLPRSMDVEPSFLPILSNSESKTLHREDTGAAEFSMKFRVFLQILGQHVSWTLVVRWSFPG